MVCDRDGFIFCSRVELFFQFGFFCLSLMLVSISLHIYRHLFYFWNHATHFVDEEIAYSPSLITATKKVRISASSFFSCF
jgi:hypothetical protein